MTTHHDGQYRYGRPAPPYEDRDIPPPKVNYPKARDNNRSWQWSPPHKRRSYIDTYHPRSRSHNDDSHRYRPFRNNETSIDKRDTFNSIDVRDTRDIRRRNSYRNSSSYFERHQTGHEKDLNTPRHSGVHGNGGTFGHRRRPTLSPEPTHRDSVRERDNFEPRHSRSLHERHVYTPERHIGLERYRYNPRRELDAEKSYRRRSFPNSQNYRSFSNRKRDTNKPLSQTSETISTESKLLRPEESFDFHGPLRVQAVGSKHGSVPKESDGVAIKPEEFGYDDRITFERMDVQEADEVGRYPVGNEKELSIKDEDNGSVDLADKSADCIISRDEPVAMDTLDAEASIKENILLATQTDSNIVEKVLAESKSNTSKKSNPNEVECVQTGSKDPAEVDHLLVDPVESDGLDPPSSLAHERSPSEPDSSNTDLREADLVQSLALSIFDSSLDTSVKSVYEGNAALKKENDGSLTSSAPKGKIEFQKIVKDTQARIDSRSIEKVLEFLQQREFVRQGKSQDLARQYVIINKSWKKYCEALDREAAKKSENVQLRVDGTESVPANTGVVQPVVRFTRRGVGSHHFFDSGDAVQTEEEFLEILATLERESAQDRNKPSSGSADIPPMFLDDLEKYGHAYFDYNRLVEDPISKYYFETSPDRWTAKEQAIFEQKFNEFPKQFGKIAKFLPAKNAMQCVLHYYRTKKIKHYSGKSRSGVRAKRRKKSASGKRAKKSKGSSLMTDIAEINEKDESDEEGRRSRQELASPVAIVTGSNSPSRNLQSADIGGNTARIDHFLAISHSQGATESDTQSSDSELRPQTLPPVLLPSAVSLQGPAESDALDIRPNGPPKGFFVETQSEARISQAIGTSKLSTSGVTAGDAAGAQTLAALKETVKETARDVIFENDTSLDAKTVSIGNFVSLVSLSEAAAQRKAEESASS